MKTALAALGVLCIFGGEAFCIFGPMLDTVHIICHIILYSGVVLVAAATALHGVHVVQRRKERVADEA